MTDRDPREPAEEGDDAGDWLASQFEPTGELPKPPPVPPVAPVPPAAAPVPPPVPPQQPYIAPPSFPGQQPPPQPAQPPVFPPVQQQQPPPQPTPPQPVAPAFPLPPQQPVQPPVAPAFPLPPQQPVQPPVAPAFPLPPQQPAQAPVAPAFPLPPAQPTPPTPPPAAPLPPVQPPAAAPLPPAVAPLPPVAAPQPPAQPPVPPAPAEGFSCGLTPASPAAQPPSPTPPTPPPAQPPAPPAQPPAPPAQPPTPPAQPGAWFEPVAPLDAPPLDAAIAGVPPEATPPPEPMPFETTVLPDVAPDSRGAPAFWEPEPTQMMDVLELEHEPPAEEAPKQPFTRSVFPEGTELLPEAAATTAAATTAFGAPPGETGAVSAIDSLFGETQFREYSDRPDPTENPFVRKAEADRVGPAGPSGPPPGISPVQRILLSVLGALLAVIILVGLFFLGIRLPDLLGPAPAIASPSASPSPSASAGIALGPVAPGEYHWDELLGGECLDPFESAFEDDYTVVECAEPHAAQMVRTGILPVVAPTDGTVLDEEAYPGEEALQTQTLGLCRVAGIFAPTAAALTDALITASYPTSEQWDEGNRSYYCFVSRSSGEPITGDLALPQVAPVEPAPAP